MYARWQKSRSPFPKRIRWQSGTKSSSILTTLSTCVWKFLKKGKRRLLGNTADFSRKSMWMSIRTAILCRKRCFMRSAGKSRRQTTYLWWAMSSRAFTASGLQGPRFLWKNTTPIPKKKATGRGLTCTIISAAGKRCSMRSMKFLGIL